MKNSLVLLAVSLLSCSGWSHTAGTYSPLVHALVDLDLIQALELRPLVTNENANVGYVMLTEKDQARLADLNHQMGRCGGFEAVQTSSVWPVSEMKDKLTQLESVVVKNKNYSEFMARNIDLVLPNNDIREAIDQVSESNLKSSVEWLSSFHTRNHRYTKQNDHVMALKSRLETMLTGSKQVFEIKTISHRSTPQLSLHLRLVGKDRPNEIVVLGGHLDSVSGWSGGTARAPGADDNASGSANLIEIVRILGLSERASRTIDVFWYAAEEAGLLGSAEIAETYKLEKKNVIGVLQLDMTLFPGEGELVIGNVSDYTSAWLRDWLVSANNTYLNLTLVDDKCGYACSDHASWFKNGFPTLLPFEATTETMNRAIHTANDVINAQSSFRHSAQFSKIGLIFALDLGNSEKSQPY